MINVSIKEKRFAASLQPVISDISFTVNRGEFVAVIGPSGAGKSTLLQLISGLDNDFSGNIELPDVDGRAARISYMFQEPRLMPWLTALENVRLVAGDQRHASGAKQILENVGLGANLDSYPAQLSGGMQRRVALARAFMHEPDILLMDEPFVSLDQPVAEKLRQLLLDLWQDKQPTVLFVSHDLDEAIALADRLLFLSTEPASVILDRTVTIARPRIHDKSALSQFKHQLLETYPELLTGRLSDE